MHTLLFIGSTNLYRSRFCEHLFNHLATQQALDWQAISRGVALKNGMGNVGPISPDVTRGLHYRGIATPLTVFRDPLQLTEPDLRLADTSIVVDGDALWVPMNRRFPAWVDSVHYWQIGDLSVTPVETALALAERNIRTCIHQLAQSPLLPLESQPNPVAIF